MMSMYGEDGSTGYAKEDLYYEMKTFLENHSVTELMSILTDVLESMEK